MHRARLILFVSTLLTAALAAKAQHYALRQYTAVDGLPQSQVNAMAEDRLGYLWIGTAGGGLACFDGREFKVYTTFDGLLSNIVTSLFIDSRGVVWVIHPQGLTRFDRLSFRKYQLPVSPEGVRRIRRMAEYRDTLFMVSNPGLIGKIYRDSVYSWYERIVPKKSIYFTHVTTRQVPCYYLSDSSFLIPSSDGYKRVPHASVFNTTYNMYNHGNEMWLETDKGTFALNPVTGTFSPRRKMVHRYIIGFDSLSSTYWTRDERTLFRERVVEDEVVTDTILSDVPITQVLLDKEGNAWFGSAGNGLYRYYPKDFNKLYGALRKVSAIGQDKSGALWLGGEGLVRRVNGKVKPYTLPNGDDDGVRAILQTPKGELWVGSYSGLGHYDSERDRFQWFTREHGLTSAYVTSLENDDSNLWIGTTGGGLNQYDGKTFKSVSTPSVKNVASLKYMRSRKTLFIGTDFGLFTLDDKFSFKEIPIPQFEHTTILSMSVYRDTLLLAASGGAGVAIIDPQKSLQTFIGPREGLPSGFVFLVSVDQRGHIWIGTEKGITRIRLNQKLEVTETRDYGHNNGLTGIETNPNACYLTPTQKYFGLIDGLYEFLGEDSTGTRSYPVHLTAVEIFYGETPISAYGRPGTDFFRTPTNLTLPFDKNHITFTFNRVDKRYPNSVRYRYFLESFDNTWSQPSSSGRVTYSNLPTGKYVFRVMATNQDGSWEAPAVGYPFSVEAPFYRTAAFFAVMAGLLMGSAILFVLVRMRKNVSKAIELEHIRQREQEMLRKEIARDFHDEMGNQLTRIINYVSLMRLNGEVQGQELYRKVEESAKYLYNGTRDFIWAIDPVNDDLAKLFLHIRDFGQKLFEEKEIHFRAFNETSEKVRLPYGFSREANLIFKEAMTNAFKHASAKNVSFWLRPASHGYEMVLEDDGVGIDPEKAGSSNGIKNIRARAEKLKANLVVGEGPKGTGTRVQLVFTVNKKNAYDHATQKTRSHR